MDERLRFVARLLDGEKMAVLCREFDISGENRLQNLLPL
jgi:putative transposase